MNVHHNWWQCECSGSELQYSQKMYICHWQPIQMEMVSETCKTGTDVQLWAVVFYWWSTLMGECLTWGIVLSDLHIVSRASLSGLQAEVAVAKGEVMPCGPLQVPLTAGAVRIVGLWETRAVDRTPLTYIGTSTCCWERSDITRDIFILKWWNFSLIFNGHVFQRGELEGRSRVGFERFPLFDPTISGRNSNVAFSNSNRATISIEWLKIQCHFYLWWLQYYLRFVTIT